MIKRLFLLALAAFAVGMAVPSTRAQIEETAFRPIGDWVGTRLTPRRLDVMADQIDVRLGRAEGLPRNFEGWLRRYYSGPGLDPWDRPWFLQVSRRSYTVGSMGPDGEQGTDDDLVVTRDLPRDR